MHGSPQPGVVTTIETIAGVLLLKGPPRCHSRQLAATKSIEFAMGSDGGQEVEEVKDDSLSRTILDANGDECLE